MLACVETSEWDTAPVVRGAGGSAPASSGLPGGNSPLFTQRTAWLRKETQNEASYPQVSEGETSVSLRSRSHAHHSGLYFYDDFWLSYTLEIPAVTIAFSIPQFCSCTKTSRVIHLVPMCSWFLCLEETVVKYYAIKRSPEQQWYFSPSPEEKLLNLLWISTRCLMPHVFSCAYCSSVADRVAKRIIQHKLKCMRVLKSYEREEVAVLSWPKYSTNVPHTALDAVNSSLSSTTRNIPMWVSCVLVTISRT